MENAYNPYAFSQSTVNEFITEAFERTKINPSVISGQQLKSAIRSLNFMFTSWLNKGLNLFTVQKAAIPIVYAEPTYSLPNGMIDILEMTTSSLNRILSVDGVYGIPYSSAEGDAALCFDGDVSTGCIQTSANGYISYQFPAPVTITYIGIQSLIDSKYTLNLDYSFDGTIWTNVYQTPTSFYNANIPIWWVPNAPISALYWRIQETGGGTLKISEIYFDQEAQSKIMAQLSRSEYAGIPNKNNIAPPTSYVFYKNTTPYMSVWPIPDMQYTHFYINYSSQVADVDSLYNPLNIPQRFFDAAVYDLAARLAEKFAPAEYDRLISNSLNSYKEAAIMDTENVPVRLTPSLRWYI